jgi:hypothetical protein
MRLKLLKLKAKPVSVIGMSAVRSSGAVTPQKPCQALAPSILAAS